MANKVLVGLLSVFVLIAVLAAGPWWNNLMGSISPPPPNVTAIYLGTQEPIPSEGWQFIVKDRILTECMVAYAYSFDGAGKLVVYEIDAGTLHALGIGNVSEPCGGNTLQYGVLAVNFTEIPEGLAIEVWISKSSTEGNDVYFQQIGNWRFINGSYIGFTSPPADRGYILMDIEEVRGIINQTGIWYINRR